MALHRRGSFDQSIGEGQQVFSFNLFYYSIISCVDHITDAESCRCRVGRCAFRTIGRAAGTDERDQQFVVPTAD